jgi:hypothetical protein
MAPPNLPLLTSITESRHVLTLVALFTEQGVGHMADSTIGTAPRQRPLNATRGTRRAGKAGTLGPMRVLLW